MATEFAPARQMAFHFTASNCIGCHSCEAACSEKNGLPSHIAWRKVGYVESGCFPDYRRVNISMACNHCDDPVCLKGCPTRAYVKYADTGAVIQDPEVCFGCQYCTWVCPYGAPVFDPQAGTVSKCNFCVDRQAEGLNPACVDACLGHALEFGDRDGLPQRFGRTETAIPGFPNPAITRPNVRFQFDDAPAPLYTRTDSVNLAYADDPTGGGHRPTVARESSGKPDWSRLSWRALQSSESPLVAFTLIAQAVVGAFAAFVAASAGGAPALPSGAGNAFLALLALLLGYGLFTSTMHLGRPRYFYRAMNNLRHSWVSREILLVGGFMPLLMAYGVARGFGLLPAPWLSALGATAATFGVLGLFCMAMIYRIPARPYWHHPHTFTAFFGTMLVLGPLALAALTAVVAGSAEGAAGLVRTLSGVALTALLAVRLSAHRQLRDLRRGRGEGAASLDLLTGTCGAVLLARNAAAYAAMAAVAGLLAHPAPVMAVAALALALAGEALDRFLFYLVVVPTTMPGAFFLKNPGFEGLARQTGLTQLVTTGVLPDTHGHGEPAPTAASMPGTRPVRTAPAAPPARPIPETGA